MKRFMSTVAVTTAVVALMFATAPAFAQPLHLQKGSVLVFPVFDTTAGAGTIVCVTNTNTSRIYCPNTDFLSGDVVLHYQYIDGEFCLEFDRYEYLSPGDTLCLIVNEHNPESKEGFLVVSAVDPSDFSARIDFDYLIGSAMVVQSDLNFMWAYTPYAFRALPQVGDPGECDIHTTDGDADGAIDFDGVEYDLFPAEIFIDSFFEETGNFTNLLTLMSTSGQDYINEVDFLFWNNIEGKYSRTFKFVCWWTGPLSEISLIAKDLGGLEGEIGKPVETGWVAIKGSRILDLAGNPVPDATGAAAVPALLGTFAQFIDSSMFAAGHALHYRGSLDGLEILNGDGDPQQP